jgi:hypothetical protein
MKLASYHSLLLCLLLGLTVLFLSACENKVNVTVAQNGKIVLNPNYGDHILWSQGANGLQVHFLVPSLCQETDVWIKECHVNVKVQSGQFGQYNYICRGGACRDPEVDVGASTGMPKGMKAAARDSDPDFQVALPCDSGTGTIQPAPSDVPGDLYDPNSVTPGKVVQWLSNGIGTVLLSDWTVTFEGGNAKVCNESDIHNADRYRSCTLKQGLAAGTYRYTAKSGQCKDGQGTVTLK